MIHSNYESKRWDLLVMNIKTIFKVGMFNLSLLPLYLILFIQHFDASGFYIPESFLDLKDILRVVVHSNRLIFSLAIFLLFFGFLTLYVFNRKLSYGREDSVSITNIRSKEFEHLTFIATYVLPLFAYQIKGIQSFIVFLSLLILIGSLYVKSNWYYLNPILLFFGYSIYSAEIKGGNVVLITRFKIINSQFNSRYIDLGDNIIFLVDKYE